VQRNQVPEVRRRIKHYQRFKELNMALTQAYVDLVRSEGLTGKPG